MVSPWVARATARVLPSANGHETMRDSSLFELYRYLLGVVVCTYVVVRAVSFIWRWQIDSGEADRPEALIRRYLVTVLLRTRVRRYWFELAQIVTLAGILVAVIQQHD